MKYFIVLFDLCFIVSGGVLSAQEQTPVVGIVDKLGSTIPLDAVFHGERGETVALKQLFDKPVILALVYYQCPGICGPLLDGLRKVVDQSDLVPGKDYTIVTISFDDRETPELATAKKKNYLASLSKKIPEDGWRFLTGDETSIRRITDAVGFGFKKEGDTFLHAATLIALSPEGKIARYLYGTSFLPLDLQMAVIEASEGKTGTTISKVLKYCFSYDPEGRRYTFNVLKVFGLISIAFVLSVAGFVTLKGRMRKKKVE